MAFGPALQETADAKTGEEAEEDERNIADLLVDQLEFADVIILNKTDLVPRDGLLGLEAFLRVLNPGAKLMAARESKAFHLDEELFQPVYCNTVAIVLMDDTTCKL